MNTNNDLYESAGYRRSRTAYICECAFEYFVSLLLTDSFLAKLLSAMDFSDAQIGILSSVVSLAFMFQLCAVPVVRKIGNTKRFSILFHTGSEIFFLAMYLIPFLSVAPGVRRVLVPLCLLIAYFGNYFVSSITYRWGNSFADPHHRADFGASKEIVSLLGGIPVSLLIGYALDRFEAKGDLYGGFLFTAIAIAVFSLCDLACLLLMQKELRDPENDPQKAPLRDVLAATLGSKKYRSLLLLTVLYYCMLYFSVGFIGIYKTEDLGFSLTLIQAVNIGGQLLRAVISRPFGKLSDRTSFAHGTKLGLMIAAASFLVLALTGPGSRILIILHTILLSISYAGTSQNMLMMSYNYVDQRYFSEANAIKTSIAGIFGFLASLLASRLLALVQQNGNTVFGLPLRGQQLLGIISLIFALISIAYTHLVLDKK